MPMDLEAVNAQMGAAQQSIQTSILKKANQGQRLALELIKQIPPPPGPQGVGGRVDLSA